MRSTCMCIIRALPGIIVFKWVYTCPHDNRMPAELNPPTNAPAPQELVDKSARIRLYGRGRWISITCHPIASAFPTPPAPWRWPAETKFCACFWAQKSVNSPPRHGQAKYRNQQKPLAPVYLHTRTLKLETGVVIWILCSSHILSKSRPTA